MDDSNAPPLIPMEPPEDPHCLQSDPDANPCLPRESVAIPDTRAFPYAEERRLTWAKYMIHEEQPFALADLYRGRSAFLILGGPSLADVDLSRLRQPGILTCGVNNSVRTFRPNLWVCVDEPHRFIRSVWLDPTILKFVPRRWNNGPVWNNQEWQWTQRRARDCPGVFFFNAVHRFDPATFLNDDAITDGMAEQKGGGRSVMMSAIRLMYDLGIRRLFLLGCDFRMDADHAYHFEQRRGTSAIAGNRFTYKRLQERFTQLRAVFEAADFNVYNCNPRSKLTAFDFVSFDDAVSLTLDEFDHIDVTTERTAGMYDVEKPKFSPMVEAPAAKPMPTTRRTMGFDVTLLTPTGDRHHAFALCEQWMRRQTFRGRVQWVVVDDGGSPTTVTLQREGWQVTYIPRQKQADDPKHTLSVNMLAGLGHAQSGKIIMVEDDEWYHPTYVETMARWLDETELVGYGVDVYAHLCNLRWNQLPHERHASLNKTAFRASVIKAMTDVCQRRSPSIDHLIWRTFKGSKRVHMVNERRTPLSVGWKGMPGRSGLLPAHQAESRIWRGSRPFEDHLEAWLGEDAATYRAMSLDVGPSHPVVYTAIIGGYDQVQPVPVCPGWDYICFSDQRIEVPDPWRLRIIQRAMEDPTREARRLKLLAHRWFPRAPYTIWLDGHLRLTRSPSEVIDIMDGHRVDVMPMRHTDRDCVYQELAECLRLGKDKPDVMRAQVQRYRDEGYPEHAGMVETGCLVRRHTPAVAAFNEAWWDELSNWSRRDQLSFNYVARKLGLSFHAHGSDSDARLRRDYVEIVNPRHRKITDEQAVLA